MRLPVHIWIREENASPDEIAGYFVELARRLDGHPQRMRLVVESTVPASLDFDPEDGNPVVAAGGSVRKFDIRHRWLPEHTVPLNFGRSPVVLLVDPIDGNRFRVRSEIRMLMPRWIYALLALSATVAAITFHPAAVAVALLVAVILAVPYVKLARKLRL